jgi:methionine-rich copper-binding protein CopC
VLTELQEMIAMKTLLLATMTLAILAAKPALAHTELSQTVPADHAMIAAAPEDVQLKFSEPVRLTALSIQRDGTPKQSLGPLPADTIANFTVALPSLDDGHYVVTWRALSEDTHVMSGEFMFAVGASGSRDGQVNDETEHAGENAAGAHAEHADQDNHDDHSDLH